MAHLTVSFENQTAFIKMSNTSNGNSFDVAVAEQLLYALESAEFSQCKSVIFSSQGQKFFCAGGNLTAYKKQSLKQSLQSHKLIRKALKKLLECSQYKIVVVEGDCFGGGMELLACFDYVLSTPENYFGFWQQRLGLSFGWGGRKAWLEKLSARSLKRQILEANSVNAFEAKRNIWIDEIVISEKIWQIAKDKVSQVNAWPGKLPKSFFQKNEKKIFESLWAKRKPHL